MTCVKRYLHSPEASVRVTGESDKITESNYHLNAGYAEYAPSFDLPAGSLASERQHMVVFSQGGYGVKAAACALTSHPRSSVASDAMTHDPYTASGAHGSYGLRDFPAAPPLLSAGRPTPQQQCDDSVHGAPHQRVKNS